MAQPTLPAAKVVGSGTDDPITGDQDGRFSVTPILELRVGQATLEDEEAARLGILQQVSLISGLAALTALPTTVAGLSLYNADTDPGKMYVIHSFGSVEEVIDATQADTTALFAMNNVAIPGTAAPTATALTIRKTNGRKYDGQALAISTATVVNDGWFGHGQQAPLAPAVAGANWKINEVFCRGMYIVRPGGQFNIQAVKAGAAAAAQQFFFIRWTEKLTKMK